MSYKNFNKYYDIKCSNLKIAFLHDDGGNLYLCVYYVLCIKITFYNV